MNPLPGIMQQAIASKSITIIMHKNICLNSYEIGNTASSQCAHGNAPGTAVSNI